MRIALVTAHNPNAVGAMNKDLNAGYGTHNDFGTSWVVRKMRKATAERVVMPVLSMCYAHRILRAQGHDAFHYDGHWPSDRPWDLIIVYGSIVDQHNEHQVASVLKGAFPKAQVVFTGPYPSVRPNAFFPFPVILGPLDTFLLQLNWQAQFSGADKLNLKTAYPTKMPDLNRLPTPMFPTRAPEYSYYPALKRKPFFTLQASWGCPYKCADYCTYGATQGPRVYLRKASRVADDMQILHCRHGVKAIQFRDPIFGLDSEWLRMFCLELACTQVDVEWGIEARLDVLRPSQIRMMAAAGLKNINEGFDRQPPTDRELENLHLCRELGVNVSAFYVLGRPEDTEESVEATIRHAIRLNTPLARFAVFTPYPGTKVYERMQLHGKLLNVPHYQYTQFRLVYDHPVFTPERMDEIVDSAYRRYYLRPGYAWGNLV